MRKAQFLRAVGVLSVALLVSCLGVASAHAQVVVYEGFQYGIAGADRATSVLLHGQPDGEDGDIDATGLGDTWQDSTAVTDSSDMFVMADSLVFGDLASSGNHVRGDTNLNNDTFSRPITASLPATGEMWFSILANKLQNNFSAAEGGMVIGNQTVNNPRILLDTGSTGLAGFGVAPTTAGNNWTAYAWDGSSQSVGDAVYGVPTNGTETNLLIGKISLDTGTGGADEYTLYYYDKTVSEVTADTANLIQICSTLEVDVDQASLDMLSLTRQVNTAYDEIRIGLTLGDVLGLGSEELVGDANGDGVVDAADYILVKQNMGLPVGVAGEDGDFNETGVVDWDDLQTLITGMGGDSGGAIPEPATLGLLMVGGLAVIRRRRRA